MNKDNLRIYKHNLKSRLIVGTGKYKNFKETADAVKASGADIVTVAVRRVNILDKKKILFALTLNIPIFLINCSILLLPIFTKCSGLLYLG